MDPQKSNDTVTEEISEDLISRSRSAINLAKTPGQQNHVNLSEEDFTGSARRSGSAWNVKSNSDGEEEEPEEEEEEEQEAPEKQIKHNKIDNVRPNPTLFRAGAEASTISIDSFKQLIYGFLENLRFKNQCHKVFTEKEIDELTKISHYKKLSDVPGITEEKKVLAGKFETLYARHQKKMGDIPMKLRDKENMQALFIALQEYNQKPISPVLSIWIQILKELVQGGITVYMED